MGIAKRIAALGDGDLAKVLAPRAERPHVIARDQRKARIGAAGAVRIDGILVEARKVFERIAEGVDVVGITRHAGHDAGIARLHRPRGFAQRGNRARAPERNGVDPSHAKAEMLGEADPAIEPRRETRNTEPVDIARRDPGTIDQRFQRAADPPLCALDRVTHIGNRHRNRHHDPIIRCSDGVLHRTAGFL